MMTQSLDDLTQSLLSAAKKAGAEAADAIVVAGTSVSIDVRGGVLEHAERSEATDIGLRVFVGQRSAIVSASDTSASTIANMAERAIAMAGEAPEDPHVGLADPSQLASSWNVDALELYDATPEPDPAVLQDDAARAEAAALAVDGVAQVIGASAAYGARQIHLAASNGFSGGYQRTDRMISCGAIAGEGLGMERDYDGDSRLFQADLRTAQDIGTCAGTRATERVGAKKPPSGAYPVLFDERISSSLIGHLVGAVNGAAIARGGSWLREKMGAQVLPKGLNIEDNPLRARVSGSRPFDAEGLPARRRNIVEDGVLQGWTLDLASARKLGMESTGSASRGTSSGPSPSVGNFALTQGDKTREQLMAEMGTGLLVTSMIGSTINPNTGDYSRGASGFWIENGEIAYPVNECTVAGNLHAMLATIIPANDGRMHLSRVVPSLLVEGLILAGE